MNTIETTWFSRLLWLLGFDASALPDEARAIGFVFLGMPTSWGVFILLGLIGGVAAAVFALYLRESDTCPRGAKIALASVRFAVLLLLLLILLSPALTYQQTLVRQPYVVVLRDASQSMKFKTHFKEISRQ